MNNNKWKAFFYSLTFNEKCFFVLLFLILVPAFLKLLMGINARLGLSLVNPYLSTVLYVGLFLLSFKSLKSEIRWWDSLVVLFIGVFCFYSPAIYPQTTFAVAEFGPSFVFAALPFYIIGASVNLQKHDYYFVIIGRLGLLVNMLITMLSLLGMTNTFSVGEESMGLAYNILPSVILVLRNYLMRQNTTDLLLLLLGFFLLMSLGTRGPIVASALFVVLYFLFNLRLTSSLSRLGFLLSFGLFYLLLDPILIILTNLAQSFGFGTRVYESILNGEVLNADNREWIYDQVYDYILSDNGKIGYGLFYDRVMMGMETSSYCHNIIYEICLNFGVFIGGGLLILFFCAILVNVLKYIKTNVSSLYLALFCACVVQLFFSSSYLISLLFWFFVGLTVSSLRNRKDRINIKI